jgi:hypothetical protein
MVDAAQADFALLETFTKLRKSCLISLGSIVTNEERTLLELQQELFNLVLTNSAALQQEKIDFLGKLLSMRIITAAPVLFDSHDNL